MKSATRRPFIAASLVIVLGIIILAGARVHASQTATSPRATSEYHNDKFGFSLTYPADMTVREDDLGYGAQSISFDSATPDEPFYIMAAPYTQADVAAGNFHPHEAYGTEDQGLQLRDVDIIEGDTIQVRFKKLGVIYEILTTKDGEAALINILKTWQFE